jgi:transposase
MAKRYRARRDFDGLEARRERAARLFESGKYTQAEVARKLEASRTSVHRWYWAWRREGVAALRKAGRAGRKPLLEPEQLRHLDQVLRDGALAWGFGSDLWTLPRVAKVIGQVTGVHYHPGHVWRLLRSLNWSLQRPVGRAKERREREIQRWVRKDWPRVKKTPGAAGPGSSSRTRAASRTVRPSGGRGRRGARRRS